MPVDDRTVKRKWIWTASAVMAAGVLLAFLLTQANTGNNTSVRGAKPDDSYERLKGKWMRPDGGYVIEIKNISPGGILDCSYFNPSPIYVSQAQASIKGKNIQLFIELRDTGYPGCTYNLTYDPGSDQLKGIYYQAALQQSYEILFNRIQ